MIYIKFAQSFCANNIFPLRTSNFIVWDLMNICNWRGLHFFPLLQKYVSFKKKSSDRWDLLWKSHPGYFLSESSKANRKCEEAQPMCGMLGSYGKWRCLHWLLKCIEEILNKIQGELSVSRVGSPIQQRCVNWIGNLRKLDEKELKSMYIVCPSCIFS